MTTSNESLLYSLGLARFYCAGKHRIMDAITIFAVSCMIIIYTLYELIRDLVVAKKASSGEDAFVTDRWNSLTRDEATRKMVRVNRAWDEYLCKNKS